MRLQKLGGKNIIRDAAKHNKREIAAERGAGSNIDASRCHLNITLAGPATAADVAELAKSHLSNAEIKTLRKDAVQCIEVIFSLPTASTIDHIEYFKECTDWCSPRFGIILSSDIHLDEAQPHCHVLLIPLSEGRMNGGKLAGHKPLFKKHQADFFNDVASHFGLAAPIQRLSKKQRQDLSRQVLKHLNQQQDACLRSIVWPQIRADIEKDPRDYAQALGLAAGRKRPSRTFTEIMISKGKGARTHEAEALRNRSLINQSL